MSVVTVVVLAAFVLPKFKVFFNEPRRRAAAAHPDAARLHRLPRAAGGGRWPRRSPRWRCSCFLVTPHRARQATPATACCCRLPVLGETIQYALVERFCRILASMVGAGVPLPEALRGRPPRRCATGSTSSALGEVQRGDARGRGHRRPAGQHRPVPGDRGPDDPGRRGHRDARRPARGHRASTTRPSSTTRSRS